MVCHCHHEEELCDQFCILLLVLRFLEAVQCRQCFLEVRLMPCWHRIEIHHVRANPPVATVDINFFLCGNMAVIFACKPIHLKDNLFRATLLDHRFSEELVADESIVNVVIFLLSTPLLKLICRVVFFATRCLPVPVTVWPALSYVKVRDGKTNPARTRCTSCFLLYHLS